MVDPDPGAPTFAAVDDDRPLPGRRFAGRYIVERQLGRGGMGSVHAVLDTQLGERVALKLLEQAGNDEAVERFRREVRLSRRVTHRNVARIFDIGEAAGRHFLTMELVEGGSLQAQLCGSPMPLARACALVAQVARGLAAAHEVGVIHRDLKPGNVLVDPRGRAVVTDFGIACALAGDVRLTREGGSWLGTPAYMSPEQVRGDAIEARSDLYALGVMFYELLTAALPFPEDSPVAAAIARLDREPIDATTRVPLPTPIAALLRSLLSRQPEGRPASALEVAAVLDGFAGDAVEASPSPTSSPGAASVHAAMSPTVAPAPATVASTATVARRVAVLPFRYRGPTDDAYLADALTDELIDLLSRTRGLRVAARSASVAADTSADSRGIGRQLGVDVLVEGTVQRAADAVRISARLIEVESGFQTWSDRFDGALVDVFELQDRLAKRIAETLRVQIFVSERGPAVPAEAMELYLRARAAMRRADLGGEGPDGSCVLLERALALAPDFRAAIAAAALTSERLWFVPSMLPATDRQARAEVAVARALAEASDFPETHLAAARLAMQKADYVAVATEIGQTLAQAPTYAPAHEVLGALQCEAGRPLEGIRRLRLAAELDPTLGRLLVYEARHHEMRGDRDKADLVLAEVDRRVGAHEISVAGLRARIAGWRKDFDAMRQIRQAYERVGDAPMFIELLFALALDGSDPAVIFEALRSRIGVLSPRFRAMVCQLAAEAAALVGELDIADEFVGRSADETLVDLEWMEHCPVLAGLRERESFQRRVAQVRRRAESLWHLE
ncbi:MAG: protein kinase [Nannocystaceae bacterium]|nr:protein kinase [Nannocystaceae bacterium]